MKAIALLSGGLDSQLAIRITLSQNIEVIGVNFVTPFFRESAALEAAKQLNIILKTKDITSEHLKIVKHPKYGYGKNMNPCIDCHALMLKEAASYMEELGASFLITGEVLEQRPKSQNKAALKTVEKESGQEGLILRPLSAKLLPPTIPEEKNWINREKLFSFSGRSRGNQINLAQELGIEKYPAPAGGCKLTENVFSHRLKDLIAKNNELDSHNIELLKIGRHFRSKKGVKIIVGRNKEENEMLLKIAREDYILLTPSIHKGPITILQGEQKEDIYEAAAITARYSDMSLEENNIVINFWKKDPSLKDSISISPITKQELELLRI